jgi:ribonuclease BN (tRNA processing enzyme)
MAQRAQVQTLMLTHLGPPPNNEAEDKAFSDDIKTGGYTGNCLVGRDLMSVTF